MTDATAFDYASQGLPPNSPLRITIGPNPLPLNGGTPGGSTAGSDDWSDVATDKPITSKQKAAPEDWSDVLADKAAPKRQIGGGEAAVRGGIDTASFGLAPALAGLTEAGKTVQTPEQQNAMAGVASEAPGLENIGAGLAGIFSNHPDPKAQEAYERGRQSVADDQRLAKEQHPLAFLAGQLGGAIATPGFGAGTAGTVGTRLATGAVAGGIGGGLYGAGTATSEGASGGEIAQRGVIGAAIGAPLGAGLGAVLGPRVAGPVTPGQRVAETAADLGAPLPKGVVSDSRLVRGTTAGVSSVPVFGARIHNALDANRQAAGEAIRQSGVDQTIAANKWTQNQLYNDVRGRINPDLELAMPETAKAVAQVKAARVAARRANPYEGLEQFNNLAKQGASFNGAQRARVDAREAGDVMNPHPGFNAADYNKITRAMTQDIRRNIALQGGQSAVKSFDRAERNFGPLAEANKFLSRIAKQHGPGAGLDEIGINPGTGEFSLDKFVRAWGKINPDAQRFVPAPGQVKNIRDIVEMGRHIASSMRERNTSHTSNILILWDLARDTAMLGVGAAAGVVSGASVVGGAAGAVPAVVLMHWLSSPAKAASMAAWAKAYRGIASGISTPANIASFKIATRNMANTLGVPVERVLEHLSGTGAMPAAADQQQQQ